MGSKFWHGEPLKASDVLAEAKRLSVEFPERIGRSEVAGCVYTEYSRDDDPDNYGEPVKPVCIVGTAVYNLTGKFVPRYMEGNRISTPRWKEALGVYGLHRNDAECQAWNELLGAQERQDARKPWGELFKDPETSEE